MELTFWGAAEQVTGSMFLLRTEDDFRILIDCGIDMEHKVETMPVYPGAALPFDASAINLVVLTHAHLDHSGRIPHLFREGYEGQILCSTPTLDLTEMLLLDSAALNERKMKRYQRWKSKGSQKTAEEAGVESLYMQRHVRRAMDRFVSIAMDKPFKVDRNITLTLIPTGHLLGACNVLLEIKEGGETKRIVFSGDIGRQNYPLLPDPQLPPEVDYMVCETTYGMREHTNTNDTAEQLKKVITETCIDKPGRLIIPAFSIGRTQALLYTFQKMAVKGDLPPIKIFADSPLASQSNRAYIRHQKYLNDETRGFVAQHGKLFDFPNLNYVASANESQKISHHNEPCIIISSSGMLEGGRAQNHVRKNLENPYCSILMIGFCAEGTFGHQLLNANGSMLVGKEERQINAQVLHTDAFSGHGDKHDLLRFVESQKSQSLKKIFLVHGERDSMDAFKDELTGKGYKVEIPTKGQKVVL